jgi:hypothetical protein
MRGRYGAMALPLVAAAIFLSAGCSGGSTTNEENLPPTPVQGGGAAFKSYGEAMQKRDAEIAKDRPAAKGKAGTQKQPKSEEPPKTQEEQPKPK